MGSSRNLPTSYNVSTYDSAGGKTYTDLGVWEGDTDIDLTGTGQSAGEVLECYKGNHDDDTTLSGATTDADYYRVIKPADGEGHSGVPKFDGSIVSFSQNGTAYTLRISEDYSQFHDLVATNTYQAPSGSDYVIALYSSSSNSKVIGSIAANGNDAGSRQCHGFLGYSGNNHLYVNCLAYNNESRGWYGGKYFYNCNAIDNGGYGFDGGGGSGVVAINCISHGNGSSQFNNVETQTTCLTTSPLYKDSSNNDYHLQSSDTTARDQGTDLSDDSFFSFDDDIDGDTRESESWDIGFDEYIAAGIPVDDDAHISEYSKMKQVSKVGVFG